MKTVGRGVRRELPRFFGALSAAMIFFGTGLLQAQLIDVDFNNNSAGAAHGGPAVGPTMSGAAVLGAAGDQWNGINTTNGSGISLFYANGSASNVKMTFTSGGGYDAKSYSGSTPFAGTPYNNLMEDYLFNGGTAQTITLSGLATNAAYNLVLYNAADTAAAGRVTYFTVNNNTQSSTWNATSSTLISGVDYVQFTSAMSDGSGNLAIVYIGNGSTEGDVDGFQIQGPTPVVAITNPTNGAVFTAPASVNISASATVSGGSVTNVQFFANGVSLGSVTTSPFNITASNLSVGAYTLTAVATASGISATSSVVNVSVSGPAQASGGAGYSWTIYAGAAPSGSADGSGTSAQFSNPFGNVVDTNGNIYVADTGNQTIRKITPGQAAVSTIAGFPGVTGTNDGVGNAARFYGPTGIAIDRAGNLYVSDFFNATIRKLTPVGTNWVVSTIAGMAGNPGSADGTNSAAQFGSFLVGQISGPLHYLYPQIISPAFMGLSVDASNNIYVADTFNCKIRKITPVGTNWVVTTLAGTSPNLTQGGGLFNQYPSTGYNYADGFGTNAQFCYPCGISVDANGLLYVADTGNNAIRTVTTLGGLVSTIAGYPHFDPSGLPLGGNVNGNGSDAKNYGEWQFNYPVGITVDSAGNLFVAELGNNDIREITPGNWSESTFVGGSSGNNGSTNAVGGSVRFSSPHGVTAVGSAGVNLTLYVSDSGNAEIRKVNVNAVASVFAGAVANSGNVDGTGVNARFYYPFGLTIDNAGNLYVADSENETIRQVATNQIVTTIAGTGGIVGTNNGAFPNGVGQFYQPLGVAVDNAGNVYVADTQNNAIRKITQNFVSTVAGLALSDSNGVPLGAGTNDGIGVNARFDNPYGITVDSATNLYVADTHNESIRKIAPLFNQLGAITNWLVSTIAGLSQPDPYGNFGGSADGTNSAARFFLPYGIAVDNASNLYVADLGNNTIRKIKPVGTNWVVSTIAGYAGSQGTNDGTGSGARFMEPEAITIDSAGNLLVADGGTIRKITPMGTNWVVTTIGSEGANGIAVDGTGSLYVANEYNNTILKGTFTAYGAANPVPYTYPAMTGQLTVTLTPANASGQWRFPWEIAWRDSGTTASNLVAGNYPVQFKSVPGWLAVPSSLTVPVPNGGTIFVTNQYYPTISSVSTNSGGTLTVSFVSGNPTNAGWRFLRGLGDNSPYYPAGSTNLVTGTYLIQFAPIAGRVTPPNLSIQVLAGQTTFLTENYLIAPANNNGIALPYPVPTTPTNEISDVADYPFGFNGQLQSDVGYGSGVAVQTNVVLTAAHLVFSDDTLSYVSQAYWYFQQETGVFAPEPQAARGWYILSGYAAQRTYDLTMTTNYGPDQSSPQSRNFDVAVLYFLSPVAGGGYGGYLPSDASPNPWLTGTSLKMLVGYPVDGSEFGIGVTNGAMYQTQPQPYQLTISSDSVTNQQEVYIDSNFLGYPGNSGGPLYVQFNGYYYPAGVYLGTLYNGATPYASAVRAIDSAVVNLITNAAAMGDSGTNHAGGGVITIIPSQAVSASNPGYLEFVLGPPAAVAAGAGWQLQGDSSFSSATNYVRAVLTTNSFTVVFNAIAGWNVPTNQSVSVQPGQIAVYSAIYTLASSLQIVSPQVAGGNFQLSFQSASGQSYTLYYNNNLATTNWLPYTNVTGNGNLIELSVPVTNSTQRFFRISQP